MSWVMLRFFFAPATGRYAVSSDEVLTLGGSLRYF